MHITVFPTIKSFAWNKTHYTVGLVKGDKCDDDSLLWYLKPDMISDELFFFLKFLFFHNN